ncbi:TetR/AcrR family transcriptional regulator [Sandarakinorhabdus sp. AAP62]|uniref:TetR/AcrR family transcriptional regulator n=1 Tax=Sandarakinorhabdus sp. AAP62 TaxID=1248916 RepID=UPI000364EF9D|nr:TetR/AcrR family transcriptional regulator [Sandarakinorhabdus sp. AAP62]
MPEAAEIDGRRLRSVASRDRIINAVIELVDEDQGIPGAEVIAARAGVGLRSVFRHFGDMDGLYVAVIDRIGRRYTHLSRPYEATDWQGQVREAMARRMEMFETVLPYRRAADMHRQRSPLLDHGLDALTLMLRVRLETAVGAELRADDLWFEQLDLWLSLEAYGRLRDRQRQDHAGAARVIEAAVSALLAAKR